MGNSVKTDLIAFYQIIPAGYFAVTPSKVGVDLAIENNVSCLDIYFVVLGINRKYKKEKQD